MRVHTANRVISNYLTLSCSWEQTGKRCISVKFTYKNATRSVIYTDTTLLSVLIKRHRNTLCIHSCTSSCFSAMRHLRSNRRSISRPLLRLLDTSLVLMRLDYDITTLIRLPRYQLDRLYRQCAKRRRTPGVPRTPTWPHNTTFPGPSLTTSPGTYQVSSVGAYLPVSEWPRSAIFEWTIQGDWRRFTGLRHCSSAALFVPRRRRSTIGDRAFAVAAPRVWKKLRPVVTSV